MPSETTKDPAASVEDKVMSGWKSGLAFRQSNDASKNNEGLSRYSKRAHPQKKGTFRKKVKVDDTPSLISVVNAKPEIKQRATEQATERFKKMEERKKMKARVHVKGLSPQVPRNTWTSVFSNDPNALLSPSLKKAKPPKGYKPPPGAIKTDWNKAYQAIDLLSPTSGKPKMVAKQDLVLRDRLMSPKKKTHTASKSFPLPSLDLDDEVASHEENKKASPSKAVLEINIDDEDEDEDNHPRHVRSVTPTDDTAPRKIEAEVGGDDFEGFVDEDSQHSSNSKDKSASDLREEAQADTLDSKQQLILEFALPGSEGEENDEEGLQVPVDLTSPEDLSSVGSWPSIESHDSYDTKMNKMMQRWMDVHGTNDDDRTLYSNNVDLTDNVLDHITLAVPDLEIAMEQFEEMTGIRPTTVGPLQGLGAKTAHIGLDGSRYLELIAPDNENPGPLGQDLSKLRKGTMTPYYYSIRSSEVSRLIEGYVYDVLGWDPDHIAMVQALPDKSIRQWDMLTMYGHDVGGAAPCYVKWKDASHHPTKTIALKASLTSCTIQAPEGHAVHKLITDVGGIHIEFGDPMIEVKIVTPKGPHTFSTMSPKGLVFPGYEDGQQDISKIPSLKALSISGMSANK